MLRRSPPVRLRSYADYVRAVGKQIPHFIRFTEIRKIFNILSQIALCQRTVLQMSGDIPRERHGGRFDHRKRRSGAASSSAGDESERGIELVDLRKEKRALEQHLGSLHAPINSEVQGVFDMRKDGDLDALASGIWTVDFSASAAALRAANNELVAVLVAQTSNQSTVTEISAIHKVQQLDGILNNLVRSQSTYKVPVLTAANSILCEANKVKREFHDAISFSMKGTLMSEKWTDGFMSHASARRPQPTEPMIPGIMVSCFDNLTMNVAYKAMMVGGQAGEKLDMTNWFYVLIQRSLAPNLNGLTSCEWRLWLERPTAVHMPAHELRHVLLSQFNRASFATGSRSTASAACSIRTTRRLWRTRSSAGMST